jgi:hypothetical protein
VFIGLISYSLYLWHWPVIVFEATNSIPVPYRFNGHHLTGPILLVLSLALGTASWWFVERPFRDKGVQRRPLFVGTAVAMAVLTACAIGLLASRGLPARYPLEAQRAGAYLNFVATGADSWRGGQCFLSPELGPYEHFRNDVCLAQHPGRRSLLLLGDSHSASMYPGMKAAFPNWDVLQANEAGCRMLLHEPASQSDDCKKFAKFIFEDFLLHAHVDWVILAGRWPGSELKALADTLRWAQERRITVLVAGLNSEYDVPLPHLIANHLRSPRDDAPELHIRPTTVRVNQDMTAASRGWGVPYVSFFDNFCKPACPVFAAPGVPMLFDGSHLTPDGGRMFDMAIREEVDRVEAARIQ